jgi:hypothetical protein
MERLRAVGEEGGEALIEMEPALVEDGEMRDEGDRGESLVPRKALDLGEERDR